MIVKRFEDLEVYQLALENQREVFRLSKTFPAEERFSLTDQIRRASRSVGSNIAEAWHKRRYPAHFAAKLTDSDGENAETRHWLQTALDCGHLNSAQLAPLFERSLIVGSKLGNMIENADKWKPR